MVESAEPINMICGSKKYGKKGVKSQTFAGTTALEKEHHSLTNYVQ